MLPESEAAGGSAPEPQPVTGVEGQAEPVAANAEGWPAEAAPLAGSVVLGTIPEAATEGARDADWGHVGKMQFDSESHTSSASASEGCRTGKEVQKGAWTKSEVATEASSEAGRVAGKEAEAVMEDGTGVETASAKGV